MWRLCWDWRNASLCSLGAYLCSLARLVDVGSRAESGDERLLCGPLQVLEHPRARAQLIL